MKNDLQDLFFKDSCITHIGVLLLVVLAADIWRWIMTHPKEFKEMLKEAKKGKRPNV